MSLANCNRKRARNKGFNFKHLFGTRINPLSMVAGGAGLPYQQFLKNAVLGWMLWLLLYGSLGLILGVQWEKFSSDIQAYQVWIAGIVFVLIVFFVLLKTLRKKPIPNHL